MELLIVSLIYIALLFIISRFTSRNSGNKSFFSGDRKAPWPVVAYGMVGASISGVTFISVPGNVLAQNFYYFPMVLGFCIGYILVAHILLPIYYKMNLTSIYSYLGERFGDVSHRTGSVVFMLSRLLGAVVRVFIVILVLYTFVPVSSESKMSGIIVFAVMALVFLVLLYLYTYKGGVKTIIWTDILQTTIMLAALIAIIVAICKKMDWNLLTMNSAVFSSDYARSWDWNWSSGTNVFKQIIAGIFMTVTMTGMDQGMMQKNLACKDLRSAQKNMYSTSAIILVVNMIFLLLGAILCLYTDSIGGLDALGVENTDQILPVVAGNRLGIGVAVIFIIGLISASYPSAGAAMTSLTTSFCVDFLKFDRRTDISDKKKTIKRKQVQAVITFVFFILMIILFVFNNDAVINLIYKLASYTYGPLLGIFSFGIFTRIKVKDKIMPYVAVAAPVLCFILNTLLRRFAGFDLGFSLLLVNGALTFLMLLCFIEKKNK